MTLDFEAVLKSNATGVISSEQMSQIATSLNVVPGSRQALDFYNNDAEEEKKVESDGGVSKRLREHFHDKNYILKECLRVVGA